VRAPRLLVTLEPWPRVFFRNLADLVRRQPAMSLACEPAPFWPDVFVGARPPWGGFVESALYHAVMITAVWALAQVWPQATRLAAPPVFHHSDVVYYAPAEYLPPLDTGVAQTQAAKKGDPAFAPQRIISVPPEADNRRQTIVTPPKLKLNQDVPLPNIVAWGHAAPIIPAQAIAHAPANLNLPAVPSAIAPPPDVNRGRLDPAPALNQSVIAPAPDIAAANTRRGVQAPEPSVIEPPPSVEATSRSRLGDINIGHSPVVAPAPELPVGEQHAMATLAPAGHGDPGAAVVPPAPSLQATGGGSQSGRLIALNLYPATPAGPIEVPNGNRQGTFAATPEGKGGAAGTPDVAGAVPGKGNGARSGKSANGIPPGLLVGAGPASQPASTMGSTGTPGFDSSRLLANVAPPRASSLPRHTASEVSPNNESEVERQVFAGRKSYSMMLNVPNLNSAGGSWVMHFAEMKEAEKTGDLVAPVATRAVDPGYPLELMRRNVQGTVTLSAVIQSDGSVGEVRILRGIDDQLDEYARAALAHWHFQPATRNGDPVALQAVVIIPFKPTLKHPGF